MASTLDGLNDLEFLFFFFKFGHPAILQVTDNVTAARTSVMVQHVSAFLICRRQAKHILYDNSKQKAFYVL
jgi:hypothetical protein